MLVLSLVQGWAPWVGLRPRGFGGCGLVGEGFVGFWWRVGLWLVPWVGFQLGLVTVNGCVGGRVVVRGWIWVCLAGFGSWCGLLVCQWAGLVFKLGWPWFC